VAAKADFTEAEWKTMQKGVTGAGTLVSISDSDFTDSFGEASALGKYLAEQHERSDSVLIRDLAHVHGTGFGLTASREKVETETLDALRSAVATLQEKTPDELAADAAQRGIVTRDMVTGKVESWLADAVCLATGGYGNVFFLATYAKGCNATAIWRAYKKGAAFGNPCYTQIHPTCIPVTGDHQSKLTLMSESLRNDGRIWVPKKKGDTRPPGQIPESERDYYLERKYPSFGNLAPRDISSRAAKQACDAGQGVGPGGLGVYLDFADAIKRLGENAVREKYGNLFDMYERITDENPYKVPMRIFPASHYTMGGLWVDYNLMSTIPGLHVLGEANFSDHGANRLGASALMQGLADGYFVIPYTIGHYLASTQQEKVATDHPEFKKAEAAVSERIGRLLGIKGKRTVDSFHKELGHIMWEHCGMARNKKGLEAALQKIPALREAFWKDVTVLGENESLNVDDFRKSARSALRLYFELSSRLGAPERGSPG